MEPSSRDFPAGSGERNAPALVFPEHRKPGEPNMKKLLVAAGLLVAPTSAALAQGYTYYGAPYASGPYAYSPGYGAYGDAPGYGVYDYAPGYGYGGDPYAYDRSDGPGRGNSAESQR
jgi:hypothetical protein